MQGGSRVRTVTQHTTVHGQGTDRQSSVQSFLLHVRVLLRILCYVFLFCWMYVGERRRKTETACNKESKWKKKNKENSFAFDMEFQSIFLEFYAT